MLDALSGAKYFLILNVISRYWQIPIKEENQPKTGFTIRERLFQFTVVSFSLKNTSALFQHTINSIFQDLL
jgi:hypothetical protein